MELLLDHFGNPHLKKPVIHIAGSKGKGSTAAFISAGLSALGYKTGSYLSPHISNYRERINCGGRFFPEELYIEKGEEVRSCIEKLTEKEFHGDDSPTTFELLTLLAFLIFEASNCDIAVIETGIGGRLDATNVVIPIASVITPIEMEHAEILGDTIEKIAFEKAGIIKPGVPVFSSRQDANALAVLREKAEELASPFYYLPDRFPVIDSVSTLTGTEVRLEDPAGKSFPFRLKMSGDFQAENAALAFHVLETIKPGRPGVLEGFAGASLPGRVEVVSQNPVIIVDGAHTESSVRRVLSNFRSIFRDGIIIFGSISGKRSEAMARQIVPLFHDIIISRPGTFKESDPQGLFEIFRRLSDSVYLEPEPARALELALKLSEGRHPILVLGSFYMAGEIRSLIMGDGTQTKANHDTIHT
jgi:dihydrofolate synthase/folylpolyglutamate synthase